MKYFVNEIKDNYGILYYCIIIIVVVVNFARAVLNEIYKGSLRVNEYLLFGNILHCVFQKVIA